MVATLLAIGVVVLVEWQNWIVGFETMRMQKLESGTDIIWVVIYSRLILTADSLGMYELHDDIDTMASAFIDGMLH